MSRYSSNSRPSSNVPVADDLHPNFFIKRHTIDTSYSLDCITTEPSTGDHFLQRPKVPDPPIIMHPHFWDTTGNVILQVRSTLFRLHGSNLTRHSPMFADIISDAPKHNIDGALLHCCILELTDVKDFQVLLDAMENAITYHTESPSFEYVASLLRVSTILDFPKFREFAIHCMNEAWPSELGSFAVGSKWHKHAAETVALARAFNVPSVLKRALYELLRTPGFSENPADELSKDDIILLSRAREQLSHAWIMAAIIPDSKPCVKSLKTCAGVQQKQLLVTKGISAFSYDPICGLVCAIGVANSLREAGIICGWCAAVKMSELMEQRTEAWLKLDQWLQLS